MLHNQNSRSWRAVGHCLAGSIAVALLTFICFRLRLNLTTTACLYLMVIVVLSLQGSFLSSALVSVIAGGCLTYFFTQPPFAFYMSDSSEVVAVITFLITSAIITHLASRSRSRAEQLVLTNAKLEAEITERQRAEETLRRLNRELRALSNCNQTLLRATDEQGLLDEICRIACEEAGYRMAWVAYAEHDAAKSVRPVAWTGAEEGYLANLGITWADTERGRGIVGTAIRSGKTCCIKDYATDPEVAPWRAGALQHGFLSGIALPLKDEHASPFGTLNIYSGQLNAFTPEETRLLEELAGDLAFGIVTLRSRAARQRAEQQVARLSFALDRVREAAFLADDRGRFQYVNEEACRVLGYTHAELLGMGVTDIDPEFPAERWADHWRDLKAQRSLSFETRHRTQDGRTFPAEVSANYFEYGGRAYNLALVRDITERKKAEEERSANLRKLQESEANLNRAQEVAHIGSWHLGIVRNQLTWSDEVCRMFDRPRGAALSYEAFLGAVYPEDRERLHRAWAAALQGAPYDIEHRILVGDELKWVRERAAVEFDPQGKAVEGIGTVHDITERKRAEETLRQSEAYLAEAQRLSHTGSWSIFALAQTGEVG